MVQDPDWLARVQRGRPREAAPKEHAFAYCGACGWLERPRPVKISSLDSPLVDQQQVHDAASLHAGAVHEGLSVEPMDCDEVRSAIGVPEPVMYVQQYLRCRCRFYLIDSPSLQDAYNLHWEFCPVTEAVRAASEKAHSLRRETVLTRGDAILPGWKHVP